ncbi:MAG TPA: DUF1697 domain-containing protein [Gammaproteobacteria bacterium]|nr:DUF1697 domain-containing protein [Gammaproteobacteria bacterium]
MPTYVALLRAVNVAGHARVPTAKLVQLLAYAGALDVASFGHAGNLRFTARSGAVGIVARFRDALERRHGERPVVVLRTAADFAALTSAQPFADCGAAQSDKLYVTFLARKPRVQPSLPLVSAAERLTVLECRGRDVLLKSVRKPNGFYGLPNAFVETAFGVPATTRNWSTVTRLAKLLAS